MHIALPIGNGNTLMATDSLESMGQKLTVGNNFYICLSPESKEEAERGHVLGSVLWFIR